MTQYCIKYGLNTTTKYDNCKRYHFVDVETLEEAEKIGRLKSELFYNCYEDDETQFEILILRSKETIANLMNITEEEAEKIYFSEMESLLFFQVEKYDPKKHITHLIEWKRDNYLLRYIGNKTGFLKELEVHANKYGIELNDKTRDMIYNHITDMVEPVNFHFGATIQMYV